MSYASTFLFLAVVWGAASIRTVLLMTQTRHHGAQGPIATAITGGHVPIGQAIKENGAPLWTCVGCNAKVNLHAITKVDRRLGLQFLPGFDNCNACRWGQMGCRNIRDARNGPTSASSIPEEKEMACMESSRVRTIFRGGSVARDRISVNSKIFNGAWATCELWRGSGAGVVIGNPRHINRHPIRAIKISCCSKWPAVFRIGFRPVKNRLAASMGLARTSAVVR